ncbi:chaperonin 10-like protein, partial [Phakopsora pachyrhizi]
QSLSIKSISSLRPLLDRVLVQRIKPETKTASGIFLPSSATEKQIPEATVLAAGPGGRDRDGKIIPMELKAGDKVLLPSYGGQSVKVGEEEYHLFRDSEILAKFK